jgi:diaminohydroxyphosphoribosylaminopyrimidine deaminase/5-amino-6-(5-phosphoribosylamino)uracil reductase
MTLDGQLALPRSGKNTGKNSGKCRSWITSEESRTEVHRMRHASDALLTGIGTILTDDPLLTDRSGLPRRRRLLRVVLDSKLRLSLKSRIIETADEDLLVFTAASLDSPKAQRLQKAGVGLFRLERCGRKSFLLRALKELGHREILNVLLEAGPTLNGIALSASWVHKLVLFVAPKLAGNMGVPLTDQPHYTLPNLRIFSCKQIGPDLLIEASIPAAYSE